jgi:hypothetical protein
MTPSDWIYGIVIGYLLIMGILGVIWLTITFRIKVYDFEYLYGRTFARILFIFLAILIYVFHFVIMKSITSITLCNFLNI